jgi:hypothetical protein
MDQFTDQDLLNYLYSGGSTGETSATPVSTELLASQQATPVAPRLASTTTPSPTVSIPSFRGKPAIAAPTQKQWDPTAMVQDYKQSLGGGVGGTGIPEVQGNLKQIWNGFRQGTASVADSIDAVVNLVSMATGMKKGGAFAKLRDAIKPTPEELTNQDFGPVLLRAIGQAIPVITEFAVGTKGAGKLLQVARLPAAIKGVSLAPAVAFGGIEGLTTAGKGGTLPEIALATGKGVGMGTALGAAGLVKPILHVPAVGGIFGGMAAIEGADTQDIIVQTIMGLGFGVHGAITSAKQVNTMRDFLGKHGYDADAVSKMGMGRLRKEFDTTRETVITDQLTGLGMSPEDVGKLSNIEKEDLLKDKDKEIRLAETEKEKVTKEALKEDQEGTMARNRKAYTDFLVEKGFNSEVLKNVSSSDVRELALAANPEIWDISAEGKIKQVEKKTKKEAKKQSIEELQNKVATATSQADREKAQMELAQRQADEVRLVKQIDEAVAKEQEQKVAPGAEGVAPEPAKTTVEGLDKSTKLKIGLVEQRVRDDWNLKDKTGDQPRLTIDEFEDLRTKFAIPEANRDDMFRSFKDNGITVVEKKAITDTDMAKFIDKSAGEVVAEKAEPEIPHYIKRAFQETKKKIITKAEWTTLPEEQKPKIEKFVNELYRDRNQLIGQERAYEEWLKGGRKGRPSKDVGTAEGRKILALRVETARKGIRSLLNKEGLRLAAETEEATAETKPEKIKLKTPLISIGKALRTHLKDKLKWTDEQLNQLSSKEDITALRKNKWTPADVEIDEFGRIVSPDKIAKSERMEELKVLTKTTEDDVLRTMLYSQGEIDAARGLTTPPKAQTVEKFMTEGEGNAPKGKKVAPAKPPKKKGVIKTLDDANLAYDIMMDLTPGKEAKETGNYRTVNIEEETTKARTPVAGVNTAELVMEQRLGVKAALEEFIGKKNLSDEALKIELDKLADEAGITSRAGEFEEPTKKPSLISTAKKKLTETRGSFSNKPIGEEVPKGIIEDENQLKEVVRKVEPVAKPDTGEVNADEVLAKAYARARNATPLEKSSAEYAKAVDVQKEHLEQLAKVELAIRNPATDPGLKTILEESRVIMREEIPKLSKEVDVHRQAYTDMQISFGVPKDRTKRYNGPRPGEVKIETSKTLGDGTGGVFVSEGGQGVDRFYLVQDPMGKAAPADSKGNQITAEIRLEKSESKPGEVELRLFKTTEGINPVLEDALLDTVINKYTDFGQSKIRQVKRVPGIGDAVWERRDSIEKTVRKAETVGESRSNTEENIRNNEKTHGYVDGILATAQRAFAGGKAWKHKYTERQDLLESLSTLKQLADPQQFDVDRFRAEVFPEYDRMLGLMELVGDPAQSKIPIIRFITQKVAKNELNIQYLTNHYVKFLHDTFDSIFLKDATKQEDFWRHVHKTRTSTDPEILDAYVKYRMYKEDIATTLGAKERGWYIDEYGTIKYDMNKVWDIMKEPFNVASSYPELNSRIQASLNPDMFAQAKTISERYKTWDSMPKPTKDWVQQNIFSQHGVWSGWEYLPEFIQRTLPKKFFVANMQARTAGDSLKGALSYDFFDTERGYIRSVVRGALTNDVLREVRPLVNSLPGASRPGSVRSYLEKYIKVTSGTKPSLLDPWWNTMANAVNETMNSNLIGLYFPSQVFRSYIPQLYRGLLGVDTALRNLTQQIYSMAGVGGKPVFKGALRYIDEMKNKTPEFQKFEEMISLPDEFLEIGRGMRKSNPSLWDDFKYINGKLTRAALWPMKVTEHINKGIAYFAGLEEAAAKGYDMNTAHIVGTAKAGSLIPSLELTEGQYRAFRTMGESQFLYTSAHTSPYLQGAGVKMFTPFFSFPIKTTQLIWNNLLLNPAGGKTVMGKKDYAWMRFMALTGFMATAPIVSSNLFGTDTANVWGKGLFPMTIMPAWMEAIGNIFKSIGGDPGDFVETERARDWMLRFVGQITIPWYRWGGKVYKDSINAEKGYREYGREQRQLVETSWLDEIRDMFGFPPTKFRDAMDAMKTYKDEKSRNMINKHYYLYKAVDAMEDKDFNKALQIIKDVKRDKGIEITQTEIQQAIAKKKEDIWFKTATSAPKAIKERPGFQAEMGEARSKFMPSKARAYGLKPMWSSLSETIEQTSGEPPINLEE